MGRKSKTRGNVCKHIADSLCCQQKLTQHCKATISSVQFRRSVVSDSLRPHESQHARPPCPSPTPGVHSDSRPSSPWCHPAISSSVIPFSSCPQSLPASESFPISQLFTRGGQSTGVSALASFLPKKSQGYKPHFSGLVSVSTTTLDSLWCLFLGFPSTHCCVLRFNSETLYVLI